MNSCSVCGCVYNESDQYCRNCGALVAKLDKSQTEISITEKPADISPSVNNTTSSKPVSMGQFIGLIFLFLLPFVGVIAAFICAFILKKNEIVRNFARAVLVIMCISGLLQLFTVMIISCFISMIVDQIVLAINSQLYNLESVSHTISDLLGILLG